MSKPTVTVGLPAYNAEAFVSVAIASILCQTFCDFELIIVNDGSTDDTDAVIKAYTDRRIRYIRNQSNMGLVSSLNEITAASKSPFIARMDADDLMHPDRLRRQVDFLYRNTECQVVGTSAYSVDTSYVPRGIRRAVPSSSITLAGVIAGSPFIHPSVMGRCEWFRENQYDPKFVRGEDRELWIRGFRPGIYNNIDDCLLFYRERQCFSLESYRKSCCTDRNVIRAVCKKSAVNLFSARLLAASYVKEVCHVIAAGIGLTEPLIARRSTVIAASEVSEACRIRDEIARYQSNPFKRRLSTFR